MTAYYDNPNRYSASTMTSEKKSDKASTAAGSNGNDVLPAYEAAEKATTHNHTNAVIRAAHVRAQDEVGKKRVAP